MRHLDLFSGIGGFAFAASTVWGDEYENVGFCDNNKFCQKVLKKHWPQSKIYEDIKNLTHSKNETQRGCDLITGGFPCQPFSAAGRRKGTADNRHLWPEMFRVIQEFSPLWVVAENVRGLATWSNGMVLEQVCTDLESEGYEVQPIIIPAVGVNAPHRRDRIWFIAINTKHAGFNEPKNGKSSFTGSDSDTSRENKNEQFTGSNVAWYFAPNPNIGWGGRHKRQSAEKRAATCGSNENDKNWGNSWVEVATELCGVDDGLSAEMDGLKLSKSAHRSERFKSLGNAIVPQIAVEIFKAIKVCNS